MEERSCSPHGSQEVEREKQERARDKVPFKGIPLVAYFL
jgi:hypothetical protein